MIAPRMSTEGSNSKEPSVLAAPLSHLARFAIARPWLVVSMAIFAAVGSIFYTVGHLGFRASRLDLLNPECSHNQLWLDYIDEFGDQDDLVVVVQGKNRSEVIPVLEELSAALSEKDHLFDAILHEVNLSKIRSKGLYYLPEEKLEGIEPYLDEIAPVISGHWEELTLSNTLDRLSLRLHKLDSHPRLQAETLTQMDHLVGGLSTILDREANYRFPSAAMPEPLSMLSELGPRYLLTNQGKWGLVLLRLAQEKNKTDFAPGTQAIDELRRLTARAEARHPEVKIGLTGLPVMENDEMRSSQSAMLRASLLSLLGVSCLFIAGFGGIRYPLFTVSTLLIAMAWSFGYITLAIGHLNILSIAFGVILIGLGIDFGIHYVARYQQLRETHIGADEAIVQSATSVGPGIVTGAITTAIAFCMAGFTDFTGVAELGLIAGGGIILCCFAAMFVLPALLHLSDTRQTRFTVAKPLPVDDWLVWTGRWPRKTFLAALAITGLIGYGISNLEYDHNLLNLQAEGLESVDLERQLLDNSDQSCWFALSIAGDRDELLRRKADFLKKPSVERVEELGSLLLVDEGKKRPVIERIAYRLRNLPERPGEIPIDPPSGLGQALARAQVLIARFPQTDQLVLKIDAARVALRRLPILECQTRLQKYQHGLAGDLLSRLFKLQSMANPEPPKLDDLPAELVTRFIGHGRDRYLMKIYANGNIWDMEAMSQFVREVREVDPTATGNPLQTYEASIQMKSSYEKAALFALVAIVVVLLIDFGNPLYVILALIPLGLGMVQMFGIMGLWGIPLNPANMIVLPLILGIGIDDGVHLVHDFRCQKGRYKVSRSTASAVLLTSLTTMIGFGSLMIANHRGLQSLGRVLTIGVTCCLFTSLVVLPALLSWLTRTRSETEDEEASKPRAALPRPHIYRRTDDLSRGESIVPHAKDRPHVDPIRPPRMKQ
jgi:uncharacterized protein